MMAGVHKKPTDRARGKAGKWTGWYLDARGKRRSFAGSTDRAEALRLAQSLEDQCRRERLGLDEPGTRERRAQAARPVAAHVEDYRLGLIAKGDTRMHADRTAKVLLRLLDDAAITSVAEIAPDRVQAALGRLKVRRSARTCNHALRAARAFSKWLTDSNRIGEVPRGLASIPLYSEESDRRRVRRALTADEAARLVLAAASGPAAHCWVRSGKRTAIVVTGQDRAVLYALALGTGFRDQELRSLTPESFALEGDAPAVTVAASYTKNGKLAVQPIRRDLAGRLKPWLAGKPSGEKVFRLPWSLARMLRVDLEAAGIAYRTGEGVVDFHALRATYITNLVNDGINIKTVQRLARHSTITLTMDVYCKGVDEDLRKALENKGKDE